MRRIRFLEAMTAAILSGHRRVPPYGMAGGEPGMIGRNAVVRANGAIEQLTRLRQDRDAAGRCLRDRDARRRGLRHGVKPTAESLGPFPFPSCSLHHVWTRLRRFRTAFSDRLSASGGHSCTSIQGEHCAPRLRLSRSCRHGGTGPGRAYPVKPIAHRRAVLGGRPHRHHGAQDRAAPDRAARARASSWTTAPARPASSAPSSSPSRRPTAIRC